MIEKIGVNSINQGGKVASSPMVGNQPPFQLFLDKAIEKSNHKGIQMPHGIPPLNHPLKGIAPDQAVIAQAYLQDELDPAQRRKRRNNQEKNNEETHILEVTPFQFFIDKAVSALKGVSDLQHKANNLIDDYVEGKVSIDEVSMTMTKLNLAITFATTILSTASQTFKEFTSMQI